MTNVEMGDQFLQGGPKSSNVLGFAENGPQDHFRRGGPISAKQRV